MRLCRLSIRNFRNFKSIDIPLAGNVVLIGENRVGKSNLIFAIRLVLDPTLSDSARQLRLTDFWDGCDLSSESQIEIPVDFAEFDNDPALVALLTDFRVATNPTVARLSYVYRKKSEVAGPPKSSEDFEFLVYGGGVESRGIPSRVRRRIALDTLDALRDAEGQLGSWRNSPLRPLLEEAAAGVSREDLNVVAADVETATAKLENLAGVKALETVLRKGMLDLAGSKHDLDARLRFAATDPLRLFRSIALFIDDGRRGVNEASLGSANVALIALKLAEFAWRRTKNERNYSLLCIEEPEAHLHPQLQRVVFEKLFSANESAQALILTSHSPTLAAVAPLTSIVHLKLIGGETKCFSLASLSMGAAEIEDIERYLDGTRSELLFSRGIIFVEGDAEETLVPVFAESINRNLDELGISVCNVAGVHFQSYVKFAASLGVPFAIITDWDPLDAGKPPLGKGRTLDIWDAVAPILGRPVLSQEQRAQWDAVDFGAFSAAWSKEGIFLNEQTFEVSVAKTPSLLAPLLDILDDQHFGSQRSRRITEWRGGTPVEAAQLLAMIADIGKGRLSAQLAKKLSKGLAPPPYIAAAIEYVASRV